MITKLPLADPEARTRRWRQGPLSMPAGSMEPGSMP